MDQAKDDYSCGYGEKWSDLSLYVTRGAIGMY